MWVEGVAHLAPLNRDGGMNARLTHALWFGYQLFNKSTIQSGLKHHKRSYQ
jgi:hypothetical protein